MPERNALGTALRGWRERLGPAQVGLAEVGPAEVGLAGNRRRRARGLRREELAELAEVSADYLKRLEQGRGRPSAGVVNSLARALRLSRAEYEYFCALAGHPATETGSVPRRIGPGPQRLLDRLDGTAVCLCDATWTVLAWNASWEALQCGERAAVIDDRERNLAWRLFVGPPGRVRRSPEARARFEATLVADLRAAVLRYPADQDLADLISSLEAASSSFATRWSSGSTTRYQDDRVIIDHPAAGDIAVDCDILTIRDGDLRAVVFTAEPGSADAARLQGSVAGRQRLSV
jgi:transcriptional regulator with XRE-family HTH domain